MSLKEWVPRTASTTARSSRSLHACSESQAGSSSAAEESPPHSMQGPTRLLPLCRRRT